MRYFQCSKCKVLAEVSDTPLLAEIVHHERRMRELSQDQFDHETAQRDYVENGGDIPSGTVLMGELNA